MPPIWVIVLFAICVVLTILLLPEDKANWLSSFFIHSEAAKLLAALAGVIGFGVVIYTAYQIKLELDDRVVQLDIRKDEAISRAWERLLRPAVGNTGKGDALTRLMKERVNIDEIDLSCQAIGNWNAADGRCNKAAMIAGAEIRDGRLFDIDFRYTEIFDALIYRTQLRADFRNAQLNSLRLIESHIGGSFEGASINGAQIHSAEIQIGGNEPVPEITVSDVSGARLPWLARVPDSQLQTVSFWADWPPQRYYLVEQLGWDQSLDRYDKPFDPFFGFDVMRKMSICRPPVDGSGTTIPVSERLRIARERGRSSVQVCKMSPEEAVRRYPEAYAIRKPNRQNIRRFGASWDAPE